MKTASKIIPTEGLIKDLMRKCLNRAKQHKTNIGFSLTKEFFDQFNSIKVVIKPLSSSAHMGYVRYKHKPTRYTLSIRKETIELKLLEDLIAHELAHFFDFFDYRTSAHDFQFLHHYLILSNKKHQTWAISSFLDFYMYRGKESYTPYKRLLQRKVPHPFHKDYYL